MTHLCHNCGMGVSQLWHGCVTIVTWGCHNCVMGVTIVTYLCQSRNPSVASSLRDEPAGAALRVRATRSVCTHFTTAAQVWTEGSRVSARRAASPRHQRRDEEAGGRPQARVGPARAPRGLPHLRLHRLLATKGTAKAVDTRASVSFCLFALRASLFICLIAVSISDVSNTQDLLTSSFDISLCTWPITMPVH